MNPEYFLYVMYAGLAGVVLSLLVATAYQKWSCRVFFLLALRLAIGWHFLFEGLHKVNSHLVGPTETSKPFTSEPYFRAAPGPLAPYMRQQFNDPVEHINTRVKVEPIKDFDKKTQAEQAAACPPAVAAELDALKEKADEAVKAMKAAAEKELKAAEAEEAAKLKEIGEIEAEKLKAADTDFEKKRVNDKYDEQRKEVKATAAARKSAAKTRAEQYIDGDQLLTAAKATYARWVYGVEPRDSAVKALSGVPLTAPDRLKYIEWLRTVTDDAQARQGANLGVGYGMEVKRAAEWRTELIAAESALARDAETFVTDLKTVLNGGKPVEEEKPTTMGATLDKVTMWFLVAIGTMLLFGLFTRIACVLGAGFLVMTYLTFPAFPWYPQPPGTEGNPLFINKNVIECIALLALACMPTGRWLGLDALISRMIFGKDKTPAPAA
jgi:uncharacterized membrane protein YphA (DoxX/SURF4 family)